MAIDEIRRNSEGDITPHTTPHNRFVLLSVLAFVALVTVFLLKKNMEPPKSGDGSQPAQQQTAAPDQATAENAMADVSEQIAHINGILAKDSSNYDAWVALGNIYFDANKPDEAIDYYEHALTLRPGDINVMTDLATMKRAAGHPHEAVDLLQRVVKADSTFGQAWFNLGVIYSIDLNDNKNAIAAWKHFIATSPDSPHLDVVRKEIKRLESTTGS